MKRWTASADQGLNEPQSEAPCLSVRLYQYGVPFDLARTVSPSERSLSGSVVLNALLNWMLANDIDPAGSKR